MEKLKYLYWQLFVVWLKENKDTFPSLAVCALTYYFLPLLPAWPLAVRAVHRQHHRPRLFGGRGLLRELST